MIRIIIEVEFIASGAVQRVGYRDYVEEIGKSMKLAGSVENLDDDTVRILCKGEEKSISEFKKKINVKEPKEAPFIIVENLSEKRLPEGTIKGTMFKAAYNPASETSERLALGIKYLAGVKNEVGGVKKELSDFRNDTKTSFTDMDKKYDAISKAMFAVVESIEDRNKTFETRMEKTEKNIESLLKVLVQKKG